MIKLPLAIESDELLFLTYLRTRPRGASAGAMALKVGIPLPRIIKAIRNLQHRNFLHDDNGVLRLTKEGRFWISENQNNFAFSGRKSWREIPNRFTQQRLDAYKPYAPLRSKMPKGMFPIAHRDDNA